MSKDQLIGIFMAAFGGWLMIHCPRAAVREFRSGVAKGLNPATQLQRNFVRQAHPIGFWLTIISTFLAGVMGLFFVLVGILAIFWS